MGIRAPENVVQCEGGSYLDLQYQYKDSTQIILLKIYLLTDSIGIGFCSPAK